MLRRFATILCLTVAIYSRAEAQAPNERVLFDFQAPGLSADWSPAGKIQLVRAELPEAPNGEGVLPVGHGLQISAAASTGFFTRPGRTPGNWPQVREVSFWVYRSPDEAKRQPRSSIEVQFVERDGRSRFWRKIDLDHEGWKRVSAPLAWFRWGGNRVPRWQEVDRLGVYFRDEARLWIDNIGIAAGDKQQGAEPTDEQLIALAFPGKTVEQVKQLRTERVCILSDATDLEPEKLADHLAKVAAAMQADLPFLKAPSPAPRLFVFSSREAYQAFIPRLAEQLASQGSPPQSDGFTTQGMATSFWDPRQGTLRPVYTHEFVHAWIGNCALLDNRGEWFHEGLATMYQLRFHPQANIAALVTQGINDRQAQLPLEKLCNGEKIPTNRYWQAGTLVELLVTQDKYRPALEKLIAALQNAGSTDLGPHLQPVLSTSWDQITSDWLDHCRTKYAPPK